MKRFCFIIFIVFTLFLSGCGGNSKNQNSTTSPDSITSMSISDIVNSSVWKSFGDKSEIVMMSGYPGILDSPKDSDATYKQINSFLSQSVVYTKAVPKDNITHPFTQFAGYLGPPQLTISNKQHKVLINPAWYIDTPKEGSFSVHQVSNILEVHIDGKTLYIQSAPFYDWMYNNKWRSSFSSFSKSTQN